MSKTIGFIGLGNMGRAILDGLTSSQAEYAYAGYDVNEALLTGLKETLTPNSSVQQCCDISDFVILAVKPNILGKVLSDISADSDKVFISIAAGVTLETMEELLGSSAKLIRVMPNTPALVGRGMSVLSPNSRVTDAELAEVEEVFKTIGKTLILPEKLMNAVTGVSGCGPAYGYTIIQAMADGGVKMGLSRRDAVLLAAQTILGAAQMVLDTDKDPITLRNMVTSPGGSTIAAVHKLESLGVPGAFMDAVEEATVVTEKLGKSK